MESTKYYTPDLEEFHQGFEYERWSNSAYTPEKYIKEVFEFVDKDDIWNDDVTNMLACAYNRGDTVRVKYLDKEDIESLGWKRDSLRAHQLTKQIYNKDNWMLMHNKETREVSVIVRDPSKEKNYIQLSKLKGFDYLIINNKSELKKLLKQLNIA
jgi:hypothetical protein